MLTVLMCDYQIKWCVYLRCVILCGVYISGVILCGVYFGLGLLIVLACDCQIMWYVFQVDVRLCGLFGYFWLCFLTMLMCDR